MKTQISSLINGSETTVRNLNAGKYAENPIGFFCGKQNVPQFGGSTSEERQEVAQAVAIENPTSMHIVANGVELTLTRHNSSTGKSWRWEAEISAEEYAIITGTAAPEWQHKGAVNRYGIIIYDNCTVEFWAMSGKKSLIRVIGEEFIEIK